MKNTAPHQNAHLHNKNPSPACGETGSPKGGRRDENPVLIPLDHKFLPISTVEKIAEKTKKNPSPACGRGGGVRAFVRRTNPATAPLGESSNHAAWRTQQPSRLAGPATTPLGEPSNYAAWRGQCLSRLVRCQSQILHGKIPSPACGGRWPKAGRGDKKPGFIPLGGPSNHTTWRTQQLHRLADPATTPLDGSSNPTHTQHP